MSVDYSTPKEDFQLIAKEDENYFKQRTLSKGQIWREATKIPKFVDLPPLLKEMLIEEAKEKNVNFNPNEFKLPYIVKMDPIYSNAFV